jgi:hypothetical protein
MNMWPGLCVIMNGGFDARTAKYAGRPPRSLIPAEQNIRGTVRYA